MNSDWTELPLGELVTHKKGFAFKSQDFSKDGGRRIIRVSDTNSTSIKTDDPIYLSEQKAQNYADYELSHGDIILTTVGSRPPLYDSMVGKTIRVPKEIEGALLNQNMVRLSPKAGLVDPGFLYSVLKTRRFISHIEGSARGNANQASITLEDTFQFPVLVPSLSEQRKIAEILSCWDEGIEKMERLLAVKVKQKENLTDRFFGSTGSASPKDWVLMALGQCFDDIGDGNYSTKYPRQDELVDEGVPFLTANNIGNLRIIKKGIRFISPELHCELTKGQLKEGDVLLTTRGEIGKVCLVPPEFVGSNINAQLVRLGAATSCFLPMFAAQLMSSTLVRKELDRIQTGTALKQLPVGSLRRILLPVPPLSEQRKIAEILSCWDEATQKIAANAEMFRQQKQALMQKLLTGKIRVKV